MIKTKQELKSAIKIEKSIYNPIFLGKIISHERTILFKYVKNLRILEYHKNNNNRLRYIIRQIIWYKKSSYLKIRIPVNTCGIGLSIAHIGDINVNADARVGNNCRLHTGVIIGASHNGVPKIGDNCYIGSGAKIYNNIEIGDNCIIAPNAVVTKSFESNCILGGIPATIIKKKQYSYFNNKKYFYKYTSLFNVVFNCVKELMVMKR